MELPTGEDSGVEALALEPNGDILAKVGYGNMGCWGVGLAMLTPSGRPAPLFAKRLEGFWHGLGFGAFVGDEQTTSSILRHAYGNSQGSLRAQNAVGACCGIDANYGPAACRGHKNPSGRVDKYAMRAK